MNPLTVEKSSSPATIHARVGAQRALECGGLPPLSAKVEKEPSKNQKEKQSGSPIAGPGVPLLPHSRAPRFVVTLDAPLAAGDALARIPIAITGKWVRDGNEFSITLGDLEEIVRNFKQRRNGEINVDYDHASEMPEVGAGGPVPSAGRIVRLEEPEKIGVRDSGFAIREGQKAEGCGKVAPSIVNRQSASGNSSEPRNPNSESRFVLYGWYDPTPRARKLIESREYRYISPAINWAGRDKRTGKMTGTTLTSVALTNRPFLEELPQIRLSDPAYQLVDVGDVHVDTSLGVNSGVRDSGFGVRDSKTESQNTNPEFSAKPEPRKPIPDSKGGEMKQVKLSVQDGKVNVAHDDFADEYFADPAEMKQCLDDLGGDSGTPDAPDAALAAEIASLAGMAGGADSAGAAGSANLSECVAELRRRLATHQEISLKEAGALLSENEAGGKSIAAADYFRSRVEQELDEAVKNGKVLPRQRDDWRKIALSDFPTFRKIVAEQKPQVPLRPVGLSGSGPEDAQTQVKLLAEQRMRERQISFGQALSEIGREQPELVHQYRRAVSA